MEEYIFHDSLLAATFQELQDLKFAINASSNVSITDVMGNITFVNKNFCELSKYELNELMGNTHKLLNSGYHPKEFFKELWDTITKGNIWKGELMNKAKDGSFYWVDSVIVPILDEAHNPHQFISITRNITSRKAAEKMVTHLAYYDSVTQLPNRKLFEKTLNEAIQINAGTDRKFTIFYLDIDRFKYLNDRLGHEKGDYLLQLIGARLEKIIAKDIFIARMTSDEFSIILTNKAGVQNEIEQFLSELWKVFAKPFIIENFELRLTCSVGICTYPTNGQDALMLIKNASIALNRAREKGPGQYEYFNANMDVHTYKLFTLEHDLYKAFERNEFILHYQPRIDIRSGNILGAEALIRWKHPDWGMVSPEEFIPLAEEIGLIIPMTNWALRTVCIQNKKWQDEGLPKVPISVNLSTLHFLQRDLLNTVRSVIEETKLEPEYLEIEITENILIENSELVVDVLSNLRDMGIKIALDDFGTGYCSLSYLKNIPMDIVKIDKSFMKNIPNNPVDSAIVTSVIHLAKILQKKVVAEGVERADQLTFLYEKHCDEIQGYYFSKPVNADTFGELLKKGECIINVAETHSTSEYANRRKYFRLQLEFPLSSDMSIKEFRGKEIDLGQSEVLIEDLGPGGLRFTSTIQLPVNPEIIYKIETLILGEVLHVLGYIVWMKEIDEGIYEYGLEFLLSESQRMWLLSALNRYSDKLKETPLLPQSRFVQNESLAYFRKKV